ncbi:MAG: hypothetical protein Unbinned1953contig1002_4 [Prokaryotic dsDNA virus sp.]|nr:MAG: hypothetical protein Unbinned1953contig1002_4 [Prokaryotic dsDNA virus sp.]|tara:strand:+ start:5270 stop:6184 length:915 start_codon:yes stop_codon:yes gene_type:complete
MGFNITSNYSGEHAGQYIAAALKSAKSLDFLTVLENVKFKRNITKVATSGLIVDATCDFTDAGTLTLTERVLNPKELQINVDLCKKDLLADWQAAQMRAGAHNRGMSDDFTAFLFSHLAMEIANSVETSIWDGLDANAGEFTGFMQAGNGHFENDTAIVEADNEGGAGTAFTASNIIANLQNVVENIPSAVYTKEDLYIYLSPTSYRKYLSAISALSAFPFNHMGEYTKMFEGIKLAVCPGMVENKMCAAQQSNLFFGTDLLSDHTEVRVLDMQDLDGSDNIRVVAKFTGGTQHAQGGDIVRLD